MTSATTLPLKPLPTEHRAGLDIALGQRAEIEALAARVVDAGLRNVFLTGSGGGLLTHTPVQYLLERGTTRFPTFALLGERAHLPRPGGARARAASSWSASNTGTTPEVVEAGEVRPGERRHGRLRTRRHADSPLADGERCRLHLRRRQGCRRPEADGGGAHGPRASCARPATSRRRLRRPCPGPRPLSRTRCSTPCRQSEELNHRIAETLRDAPIIYVLGSGPNVGAAYCLAMCYLQEMQWKHAGSLRCGRVPPRRDGGRHRRDGGDPVHGRGGDPADRRAREAVPRHVHEEGLVRRLPRRLALPGIEPAMRPVRLDVRPLRAPVAASRSTSRRCAATTSRTAATCSRSSTEMRLLGVGDNVVDRYRDLGRMFPGGNALNVAVAAARAGAQARVPRRARTRRRRRRRPGRAARGGHRRPSACAIVAGPNAYADVTVVDGDRVFIGGDADDLAVPARRRRPRLRGDVRSRPHRRLQHARGPGRRPRRRRPGLLRLLDPPGPDLPRADPPPPEGRLLLRERPRRGGGARPPRRRGGAGTAARPGDARHHPALLFDGRRTWRQPVDPGVRSSTPSAPATRSSAALLVGVVAGEDPAALPAGRRGGGRAAPAATTGRSGTDSPFAPSTPRPGRRPRRVWRDRSDERIDRHERRRTWEHHSMATSAVGRPAPRPRGDGRPRAWPRDQRPRHRRAGDAAEPRARRRVAQARRRDRDARRRPRLLGRRSASCTSTPTRATRRTSTRVVAAYMAAHPKVKIEIQAESDQGVKDKLRVLAASKTLPDIYFSWAGDFTKKFVRGDLAKDLTGDVTGEWKDSFTPAALDAYTYDGKLYGVPITLDAKYMVYNKKLFADNGVTVPTTLEELLAACDTFKSEGHRGPRSRSATSVRLAGHPLHDPAEPVLRAGRHHGHRLRPGHGRVHGSGLPEGARGVRRHQHALPDQGLQRHHPRGRPGPVPGRQVADALHRGGRVLRAHREGRRAGRPRQQLGLLQAPAARQPGRRHRLPRGRAGRVPRQPRLPAP